MALTTPIAGLIYPELTDVPNNQTAWANMAGAIDTKMVPRFASLAALNAAIPSPIEGQMHFRSDAAEDRFYIRQGGAWVPINFEKAVYKTASEDRTATITPTDDAHLKFTMLPNARYRFSFRLFIFGNGSTAQDFRMQINPPTAAAGVTWGGIAMAGESTSSSGTLTESIGLLPTGMSTSYGFGTSTNGSVMYLSGIVLNGASSGTFALKWSQLISSAVATTLLPGSLLRYQRIG